MTDSPIDIAIMLDDPELVRLVASWPRFTDRNDINEISIVANLHPPKIPDIITRAKAHGLIKDDGTINDYARKYIESLIASQLKKLKVK